MEEDDEEEEEDQESDDSVQETKLSWKDQTSEPVRKIYDPNL